MLSINDPNHLLPTNQTPIGAMGLNPQMKYPQISRMSASAHTYNNYTIFSPISIVLTSFKLYDFFYNFFFPHFPATSWIRCRFSTESELHHRY